MRHKPPKKPPVSKPPISPSGLNESQLKMIRGMSTVRMPYEDIAESVGWSKTTFERNMKSDDMLREAVLDGRRNAKGRVHNHLYTSMFDQTLPPNVRYSYATFWAKTKEGFTTTEKLELTGADGGPVEISKLTSEERKAAISALNKKLKLTEDEA